MKEANCRSIFKKKQAYSVANGYYLVHQFYEFIAGGDLLENQEKQSLDYFVHESSYVDEGVQIGANTEIWFFCHLLANVRIGKNCKIGQNVMIDAGVVVGSNCKIQNNVSIYKGVVLEDGVFCGPSCVFTNVTNPRAEIERKDEIVMKTKTNVIKASKMA